MNIDSNNVTTIVKRGQIFMVNFGEGVGSEQGGLRPVVILQNDIGNKYSPTTIVAMITSKINSKKQIPTHVLIGEKCGLKTTSMVLTEQIRTIDKRRIINYIGQIDEDKMAKINEAIDISLGKSKTHIEKVIESKLKDIDELTVTILNILRKNDDTFNDMVGDFIEERRVLENDFIRYCSDYNIDYKKYLESEKRKVM